MQIRGNIIHIMTNVSGREASQAELFLLIALGYVLLMILLIAIHRRLVKRQKNIHKNLVLLYDTIRYQVAKAQYGTPTPQGNEGINKVMTADHKNYLGNATAIKQEVLTIEQKNGQEIISADQRKTIQKQTKKKNILTIIVQGIGRIITLLTIGIYKLFR